jgi:hypothetical protein
MALLELLLQGIQLRADAGEPGSIVPSALICSFQDGLLDLVQLDVVLDPNIKMRMIYGLQSMQELRVTITTES